MARWSCVPQGEAAGACPRGRWPRHRVRLLGDWAEAGVPDAAEDLREAVEDYRTSPWPCDEHFHTGRASDHERAVGALR
jgi:hypothetical protein